MTHAERGIKRKSAVLAAIRLVCAVLEEDIELIAVFRQTGILYNPSCTHGHMGACGAHVSHLSGGKLMPIEGNL